MLRLGRIKESVWKRSVQKQLHNDKNSSPMYMQNVTVEGWTLAAERVVYNMMNAFAAARSSLKQMSISVFMPEETEEPVFRAFTARLGQLCAEEKIWVSVDEAKVSRSVTMPLINAVGIGHVGEEDGENSASNPSPSAKLAPDMDVIVAGSIACEGAAILALEHEAALKERFATFYVEIAQKLFDAAAMPAVRAILEREEARGTAVREGGIFAGLWDMAAAGKVGLDINLGAIPIRQHTIEVCEYFNLNPYMLLSGGCILIVASHGESVVSALAEQGICAAVIGHTTSGNDRIIRYDDEIRYLEPPKTDEIYKML